MRPLQSWHLQDHCKQIQKRSEGEKLGQSKQTPHSPAADLCEGELCTEVGGHCGQWPLKILSKGRGKVHPECLMVSPERGGKDRCQEDHLGLMHCKVDLGRTGSHAGGHMTVLDSVGLGTSFMKMLCCGRALSHARLGRGRGL
jgi:hypothetical protein